MPKGKQGSSPTCLYCDSTAMAKGLCSLHYRRVTLYGDINGYRKRVNPTTKIELKKFLIANRLVTKNGCWLWNGWREQPSKIKYGAMNYKGRLRQIHRLAHWLWNGFDINSTMQVCHHCDNPPCFRPSHLFTGTAKDNANDRDQKGNRRGGKNNNK